VCLFVCLPHRRMALQPCMACHAVNGPAWRGLPSADTRVCLADAMYGVHSSCNGRNSIRNTIRMATQWQVAQQGPKHTCMEGA
jgi:hypothetical protein